MNSAFLNFAEIHHHFMHRLSKHTVERIEDRAKCSHFVKSVRMMR
jgi:hypothetical protein